MRRICELALVLTMTAGACTAETGDEDDDDGLGDCWYTCSGAPTCRDGVVTQYKYVHLLCEDFEDIYQGQCPIETYECSDGCVEEGARFDMADHHGDYNLAALCSETAPIQPGDVCSTGLGLSCAPPPVLIEVEGTLVAYLWCQGGECVARDWLDPPAASELAEQCDTDSTGFASSVICPAGYFHYQDDRVADCVWSSCTIPCVTASDCPDGVVCDLSVADMTGGFGLCTPALTAPEVACTPC